MAMTRRQLVHLLAAMPVVPALGGCAARDRNELTIWAMGKEAAQLPALLETLKLPSSTPPISVQPIAWTAAHEKLLTGFVAGSLPEIGQIGNSWIAEMAAIGAIAPVPAKAEQLLTDQFPAVVDTNLIGGKIWAVPWYVDTRIQYYRKDLFERAGYSSPPATWDEWKAALEKVKAVAGEGNFAILLPLNEFEHLLTFALSAGARLLRDNGTRGAFSDPEFRSALDFYKSLFDDKLAPAISSVQVSNIFDEFFKGYFSLFIAGSWMIGDLKARTSPAKGATWGTAPNPGPHGMGSAATGGSSLVVFADAAHRDAAWDVVSRLLAPAAQHRFHELTGDLPARRSVWTDLGLANDAIFAPFAAQLENAAALPKVPEWERIAAEMQNIAERVVRGEFTIPAATKELDRRADRILEKRRWMMERGRAL